MPWLDCPVCNKNFYRSPAGITNIKMTTCSNDCQLVLRDGKPRVGSPPTVLTCSVCGKEFKRDTYGVRVSKTHYCSKQCFFERKNRTGYVDTGGYRTVGVNGGRMRQHRHIMEQHLGRKLQPGEVVHHINGDKLDNRIENLQLMTNHVHISHHHTGKVASESTREKARQAKIGHTVSEETRQKISESLKRHYATNGWRSRPPKN